MSSKFLYSGLGGVFVFAFVFVLDISLRIYILEVLVQGAGSRGEGLKEFFRIYLQTPTITYQTRFLEKRSTIVNLSQ